MRRNDRLYQVLRGGLYHSTSLAGWRGIRERGEIIPNDGSLPFSHGQSKASCCYHLGGISLLDLRNPRMALTGPDGLSQWTTFLGNHRPMTILLEIDPALLSEHFLVSADRIRSLAHQGLIFVPETEACYRLPIPVASIPRAHLVCAARHTNFKTFILSRLTDSCLERWQLAFRTEAEECDRSLALRGGVLSTRILTNQAEVSKLGR